MKVKKIEVTNFKNIEKVDLNLNGKSVYVTGPNGAGKSSFIQTVFTTLGADKTPLKVIKEGENKARVRVVIANEEKEIIVEKVFTASNPEGKLSVKSPSGEVYSKPATFIEELIGSVNFDMERFLTLKNHKEMVKFLKDFLKINTDEIDERYKAAYDERTILNREHKNLSGQLLAFQNVNDVDLPDRYELDKEIDKYNRAKDSIEDLNNRITKGKMLIEQSHSTRASLEAEKRELEAKLANVNTLIEDETKKCALYIQTLEEYDSTLKHVKENFSHIPDPIDAINSYNELQKQKDEYNRKVELQKLVDAAYDKCLDADQKVKAIEEERKAVFDGCGIAGLTIKEDEIMLGELPLSREQINTAGLAELAVDIILAVNPKLKIVKFDATPMDKNTYSRVLEKINAAGFQCFIEDVEKDGKELTIEVIEK